MSTRYGDRGFGRYGDSDEDRTEDRDYDERDTNRAYGDAGERRVRGDVYGAPRRGGYPPAARGGEYGRGREYGSRDYFAREYGPRPGARDYDAGEPTPRYGREGLAGSYAGSTPRRPEGEDYGRDHAPRSYGREPVRDYGRGRVAPDDDGVREYDTDYGRTTSRFYGRSGYEYGRDDYDRDDLRDVRGEHAGRAPVGRGDEHGGRGWLDRAADEVRSWFGGEEDAPDGRARAEEMRAARGRGEGKFRGRGPRNYRRSDERVREEVCDRLTDNEWLDAADVEVGVAAGEVILTGTVDSRYAKRLAESIAESVSGVANVQNNLRVQHYEAVGTDVTATALAPAPGAADAIGATAAPEPDAGDADLPPTDHSTSRAAGRG